ncbi:uncharacterized protein ZBAI_00570 [Zygosaccharomyces bailii ISA1307]|nr:uncharacterized protein ZBAI_00570 [Zygosaccharomyces bailii ISA1307]
MCRDLHTATPHCTSKRKKEKPYNGHHAIPRTLNPLYDHFTKSLLLEHSIYFLFRKYLTRSIPYKSDITICVAALPFWCMLQNGFTAKTIRKSTHCGHLCSVEVIAVAGFGQVDISLFGQVEETEKCV